jgi:hypothetical protein
MPLPPDRPITGKTETLSKRFDELEKRFDAFMERRKINDAADDEDEDENELLDPEEQLREPAEEALRNSPGSDLANPDLNEPWYGH